MKRHFIFASAAAFFLWGCGPSAGIGTHHCDSIDNSGICQDFNLPANTVEDVKKSCEDPGNVDGAIVGTFREGPCDTTGALGGCSAGEKTANWFWAKSIYPTKADVQKACESSENDSEFLEP